MAQPPATALSNRHPSSPKPRPPSQDSDYGSDFSLGEEDIVNGLLDAASAPARPTLGQIDSTPLVIQPALHDQLEAAIDAGFFSASPSADGSSPGPFASAGAFNSKAAAGSTLHTPIQYAAPPGVPRHGQTKEPAVFSEHHDGPASGSLGVYKKTLSSHRNSPAAPQGDVVPQKPEGNDPNPKDTRSPLARFRARRPLSVSDLTSGAWCELQYWYTLTRLPRGRKTRTPAMKSGTRVHEKLEVEVHRKVRVDVAAAEEGFALRLWNVIQGLRTLRQTGMTRELEVWGTIGDDGQIVNGIIDVLGYESPGAKDSGPAPAQPSSQDQTSIADFFASPSQETRAQQDKKIYLTDVKTRGSPRLPSGAMIRPAKIQLMLYHRLLGSMASQDGSVNWPAILSRYSLDAEAVFSDDFMAQLAGLYEDDVFSDQDDSGAEADTTPMTTANSTAADCKEPSSPPNACPSSNTTRPQPALSVPQDTLSYRTISQVLSLLQAEVAETFPRGRESLGGLLTIEYRRRHDRNAGDDLDAVLGYRSFQASAVELDSYLGWNLEWWNGRRPAEGVATIEEAALKCRSCEFANDCEWRQERELAHLRSMQVPRRQAVQKSAVSTS